MTLLNKQCTKCKINQPLSNFNKAKKGKYGLISVCNICRKKYNDDRYANKTVRARQLIHSAKKRAVVSITYAWVENILDTGVCQLTGLPFSFLKPKENQSINAYAPSIDRINPLGNYTESNSRIVLAAVNTTLNQYGEQTMLPILKAMVKEIENAKENTAAPVSEGTYIQGAVGAELGSISTPWTWEDDDDPHHHCGAVHWQDINHRAQESSGDSVGRRGEKMATLVALERIESNGEPDSETVRLEYRGRYLPNKP